MKALPLLLIASLVANAAFVTTSVIRTHSGPTAAATLAGPNASGGRMISAKTGAMTVAELAESFKSDNPESVRDLLRAAGLPEETVRSLVSSLIWKRYEKRMKELQPNPDPNKPWWKDDYNSWYNKTTREQRAQIRSLQRDARNETERILGRDPNPRNGQDPRLAFLPEDKRRDLQEVEQDYQDLIQEVQQDMQGISLPADVEKLRFLQEEKKRDLAALLTPEELADYDLRMSRTAQQLRWKASKFDATEDEYRKIFTLQKAFDDKQNTDAWGNLINQSSEDWQKRHDDEKKLAAQLKESLGAERYADYVRSQNYEYQQLQNISRRLSLPPDTAGQVFGLRNDIATASQRIAADDNLGMDQKKQALVDLANRTREQVRTRLGNEAADIYLKSNMSWLKNVEQGNIVTFDDDGNSTSWTHLSEIVKKPAAKP